MTVKNIIASLALVGASSLPLVAQDSSPDIEWEASLALVSDYRDRGISITDKDFAVVGALSAYHKNGWYAGIQALNIEDRHNRDFKGDFYIGYQKESGAYVYDLAIEIDSMVGGIDDKVFPELQASISRDYGLAYVTLGTGWAPEGRWISPDSDHAVYNYIDAEFPVPNHPAFTVLTHFGYDMRKNRTDLYDWSIGVAAYVNTFEFSVSYDDSSSNDPLASGTVLFGFKKYF